MPDNVDITPGIGASIATDDIAGVQYQRIKLVLGGDGVNGGDVASGNPMPVTGSVTITDGSGPVTVDGTVGVSGTVSVSGPLTDAQLRAAAVPISGTVTITDGSGPITIDASSLPLPTGAATETTLAAINTKLPGVGQTNMAGSRPVAIASDQSTLAVNQAGVSATGSLTANNTDIALSLNGASGWAVDLRGTFVATVSFQGTIDGTNWFTIAVIPAGGTVSVATVTTATAAGAWWGNATGLQQVRARTTAYTSGTIVVTLRAMAAAGVVSALVTGATTTPVSGTVTANIGTGALAAGTNAIGDVGVQYRASTTGAASIANVLSPATPAGQTVKGSAGRLLGLAVSNTNAAVRYLKIFNATAVTPGTTSALTEIAIPPNQTITINFEGGIGFATGIMIMVTAAQGLTNNGAVTGNEVNGFVAFV